MSAIAKVSIHELKIELSEVKTRISKYVFALGVFALIACMFNPWTISFFTHLSAHAVTVSQTIASIAAAVSIPLAFFSLKISDRYDEIRAKITNEQNRLCNDLPSLSQANEPQLLTSNAANATRLVETAKLPNFPAGLKNSSGTNCWANALFQMIINSPRYADALNKLLVYTNNKQDQRFRDDRTFQVLISQYLLSPNDVDTQLLREFIKRRNPSFTDGQADPSEAFHDLSDWFVKTETRKKTTYSTKENGSQGAYDLPLPKLEQPPFTDKNGKVWAPQIEINAQNKSFFSIKTEVNDVISVEIINPSQTQSLSSLMDHYFSLEEENPQNPGHVSFYNNNNNLTSYPAISHETKIKSSPQDLCISLKRFNNNNEKINCDVIIPQNFQLKKDLHTMDQDANYLLDSFIVHEGSTPYSGHYIAFVLKGGRWWMCDDSRISEVTNETALNAAKQAYMIHFSKINDLSSS